MYCLESIKYVIIFLSLHQTLASVLSLSNHFTYLIYSIKHFNSFLKIKHIFLSLCWLQLDLHNFSKFLNFIWKVENKNKTTKSRPVGVPAESIHSSILVAVNLLLSILGKSSRKSTVWSGVSIRTPSEKKVTQQLSGELALRDSLWKFEVEWTDLSFFLCWVLF